MNKTPRSILINSLTAALGLFFFAFGVYLTIQANIGAAPWDAFNLGLSATFGIKYGTASIIVSLIIVGVDALLREQLGIGMLLDAVLVGKFVDLFNLIGIVKPCSSYLSGLAIMTVGMFIMGFSQYYYMKAALGCGPRDTLLVGLKRRTKRIPIGVISIAILGTVTLIAWLLGGPIGLGTVVCALLEGPVMQLDFRIVRFDPTAVEHQSLAGSARVLAGRD